MNRIFLGGTCNETTWREDFIKGLNTEIEYFNPVVEDWTLECQAIEMDEKENKCNIHFYCLTSAMTGVFSVAEVIDSVHNKDKITILQVIPEGFGKFQLKSLQAVVDLVILRGGVGIMDDDLQKSLDLINIYF